MHLSQKTTLRKTTVGCKLQIFLITINSKSPTKSIEMVFKPSVIPSLYREEIKILLSLSGVEG